MLRRPCIARARRDWRPCGHAAPFVGSSSLTRMYGPAARCKRFFVDPADTVLHQCIRPLLGARCAPGHHGYQRASHYRTGLDRAIWVTSVRMRREDRSPSSSHPLADLGGQTDYVIGCSSFLRCSFVRAWRPFLRPDLRVQARRAQGAVKVGRRAGLTSRSHAARPCLDGPEHGARITLDVTPSHWSCRTRRCAPC